MKKLLFLSAFFIAVLVSAKENVEKRTGSEEKAKTELKNDHAAIESDETSQVSTAKACSQWVGVTAPCGASYSLCTDNYHTWGDLVEAAEYFNDVKC